MTNQLVECFPVTFSTKLAGIDAHSMPGHSPTLSLLKNEVFYTYVLWLGSRWDNYAQQIIIFKYTDPQE